MYVSSHRGVTHKSPARGGAVVHPRMDMWISCKTPTYPHTHTPTDALTLAQQPFIKKAMKPGQPQSGCSPDKQMGRGAPQWFGWRLRHVAKPKSLWRGASLGGLAFPPWGTIDTVSQVLKNTLTKNCLSQLARFLGDPLQSLFKLF